jgi:flagellar motor switch protein FliM
MSDQGALSRWEIEALLKGIPAEEAMEPAANAEPSAPQRLLTRVIKAYDFRRPDKFSKEQWATLQAMHEHFARMLGASFSSRLRTLVTIRLSSIDQGLYEEWQSQVPNPTVCYVLSLAPLSGNIVVELNLDIAAEVVDRLLGGTGTLLDRARELGEVEVGLLRSFSRNISNALQEMWANVRPMEPTLQDLGQDASLIQVAAPTDVVLTAFFEVSVAGHMGAMSICVPYTVIEPIAPALSAQVWIASSHRQALTDEERHTMEHLIGRSRLDVSVRLGGVDLPARSIVGIAEGDTFVLDARLGRPLEVLVGEHVRFLGLPGVVGNHVGVQVSEVVQEETFGFLGRKPMNLPSLPGTPAVTVSPLIQPLIPSAGDVAGDA